MDPDGGSPRQLTDHFGADVQPDVSADGRSIVWLQTEAGSSGWHIVVMGADGSNPHRITQYPGNYQFPRWSPDGTKILYSTPGPSSGELFLVDADGSHPVRVAGADGLAVRSGAWSPDGTRLAFDLTNGDGLWTIRLDDHSRTRIYTGRCHSPAWSPDGSTIACSDDSQLRLVAADGSGSRQLTSGQGQRFDPAWSPDGTSIAYMLSIPDYEIHRIALDGSDDINLTRHPAGDQQPTY
ncbi:MAG TPA: hypothetical protein VM143_08835 [Acidimicrobiales bacterium]|nr:hypothetical protein [Acidimicrobiales bacterium]